MKLFYCHIHKEYMLEAHATIEFHARVNITPKGTYLLADTFPYEDALTATNFICPIGLYEREEKHFVSVVDVIECPHQWKARALVSNNKAEQVCELCHATRKVTVTFS